MAPFRATSHAMTLLVDNIRAWLQAHPQMNMKKLSLKAGLNESYVRDLVNGRSQTGNVNKLAKLAEVMGMTVAQLLGEDNHIDTRPEPNAQLASPSFVIPPMRRDLPVLGTAEAGPDGAMQLMVSGAVDYVRRPPALANSRDAYAIYVVGDSMEPAFSPGSLVLVHPHRPTRIGDFVIVQSKDDKGNLIAYLKKLKKIDGNKVLLEQFNPPSTITLKRSDSLKIHKVLNINELFGA